MYETYWEEGGQKMYARLGKQFCDDSVLVFTGFSLNKCRIKNFLVKFTKTQNNFEKFSAIRTKTVNIIKKSNSESK